MSELILQIEYRGIPLIDEVSLSYAEGNSLFVPTEAPMPVGTVLQLRVPQSTSVLDAKVIEVCERTQSRRQESQKDPGMTMMFLAEVKGFLDVAREQARSSSNVVEFEADLPDEASSPSDTIETHRSNPQFAVSGEIRTKEPARAAAVVIRPRRNTERTVIVDNSVLATETRSSTEKVIIAPAIIVKGDLDENLEETAPGGLISNKLNLHVQPEAQPEPLADDDAGDASESGEFDDPAPTIEAKIDERKSGATKKRRRKRKKK